MPDPITVVNPVNRPVDLDSGAQLAPGEQAEVADTPRVQTQIGAGLLAVITAPEPDEPKRPRRSTEKETNE